jgi:integrase
MARERLTDLKIKKAKPPKGGRLMLSDGGNLLLQITHSTSGDLNKSWIFRYERDGKRHDIGLGSYPDRTLQAARDKAQEFRRGLLDGIDPVRERERRRSERLAQAAERARAMTFKQCAVGCIESHADGWRNEEHHRQWITSLEQYAYPALGDLPVDVIATPHIVKALEPIWKDIPETASRVRGRIEKVLGWATVRGFRSGDNPARWRGHLAEIFPAVGKIAPAKHHAALPFTDVPALMAELAEADHVGARALEFTILTAARAGEVLGATWDEIEGNVWTVPGNRMKGGKPHRVPLSDRAMAILNGLCKTDNRIFPIADNKRGMLALLQDRRPGVTVHGFRSSFRDWASERTSYPPIVAEQALAHAIGSKVERAYHRTDLFEKRRRLMADWATWCSRPVPTGATVTALRA